MQLVNWTKNVPQWQLQSSFRTCDSHDPLKKLEIICIELRLLPGLLRRYNQFWCTYNYHAQMNIMPTSFNMFSVYTYRSNNQKVLQCKVSEQQATLANHHHQQLVMKMFIQHVSDLNLCKYLFSVDDQPTQDSVNSFYKNNLLSTKLCENTKFSTIWPLESKEIIGHTTLTSCLQRPSWGMFRLCLKLDDHCHDFPLNSGSERVLLAPKVLKWSSLASFSACRYLWTACCPCFDNCCKVANKQLAQMQ